MAHPGSWTGPGDTPAGRVDELTRHFDRQASSYDATTGTVLAWIMNHARRCATDRLQLDQVDGDARRPPRRTAKSRTHSELAKPQADLDAGAQKP